ncbi:MAG: hypothetical protein DRI54_05325 [Bacteroidetes bacterium]|nr:MAG: hypothetical protein DRI54_05325 [Bacteroidota bacterium]
MLRIKTLLILIFLSAFQLYGQDSSYFFLDCPNDVTVVAENPANGAFVNLPLAVAYGNDSPFVIINDYNGGGADASDNYPLGNTVVTFTATNSIDETATCSTGIYIINENDSTIYGCMDPAALNFNPYATIDDGSCIYDNDSTDVYGCMDPVALNFNPYATIDDGSCIYDNDSTDVYGCMDPAALNFNPYATIDDGSCVYDNDSTDVYGCMDPAALNYNPYATIDDGSCFYDNDTTGVYGCMDPAALNYNPFATIDDGSCIYFGDSTTTTCMAAFQITQVNPVENTIVISNTSIWEGDAEFVWDFGDGTTSTEPYPEHTYDEEGVYLVCLTINNTYGDVLCIDTYCDSIGLFGGGKLSGFTLEVIPNILDAIVEPNLFTDNMRLYPNPASEGLNVVYTLNASADINITIYDLSGRVVDVISTSGLTGNNRLTINVSELNPGAYIIELNANQKHRTISRFNIINR